MLDVLGLAASVITIATAVIEGVKIAKTLYHASEELIALQASILLNVLEHSLLLQHVYLYYSMTFACLGTS